MKRTITPVRLLIAVVLLGVLFVALLYNPANYIDIPNKYDTPPDDAELILFVGNSYLYHNAVPYMMQLQVPDGDRPIAFEALLAPKASLRWHIIQGDVAWYGEQENYDVVVLQPEATELLVNEKLQEEATRLSALSRASRTFVMQTWPRDARDGAADLTLDEWNETTWANAQGAWVPAPVGNAFVCVFDMTRIDLWEDDGNTSLAGAYVAALTLYHALRGSKAKRSGWAPKSLPDDIAKSLAAAVDHCIK